MMTQQQPRPTAVVALAASAGGLKALTAILSALPADFPAALLVVQHILPHAKGLLAEALARRTPLRVKEAQAGDVLNAATVYVAPPDHHLLVNADQTLSLSRSAKVHHARPSADPLFASAAASVGNRLIAVVLTGGDHDGSGGVRAVKQGGGTVLAQDEASSEDFSMPRAAIQTGAVDFVLPLSGIAAALVRLIRADNAEPESPTSGRGQG
jgi:two-component system chemotaxis response regulator CheB